MNQKPELSGNNTPSGELPKTLPISAREREVRLRLLGETLIDLTPEELANAIRVAGNLLARRAANRRANQARATPTEP